MLKPIASVVFLAASTLVSHADPIADRQALMKENAAVMRVLAPMAQEKAPFDAATALAALQKLSEDADRMDVEAHYPAGTETGDTKAGPAIWSDREGFNAAVAKFQADAKAAVDANPQDLASFKATFGPVAENCGACHQKYRQ
ncbi:c-type cytochrome [Limoniibacter endophyticus]|uniref:Cytochrome C556 n=1 Tax=Limoniibacter endophyticus TaxID=1565040 RepID=A0A8J3GH53_9HYPH|nr:cytochrome c [Limoniibacter endophyticus]GHC69608.1 cytochrome C556 [Limoniibacter endophyticus]